MVAVRFGYSLVLVSPGARSPVDRLESRLAREFQGFPWECRDGLYELAQKISKNTEKFRAIALKTRFSYRELLVVKIGLVASHATMIQSSNLPSSYRWIERSGLKDLL